MKNIAVILAGGSGNRLGKNIPKQFLQVAGKQIIEYTIETFEHHQEIDEICLVCKAEYVPYMEDIVARNHYRKVTKILSGGKERYDSSLVAINAYPDEDTALLFHDAVRPLVSERIIHDCVEAMKHYNAVGVAVKTTDTIISADDNECIRLIHERSHLRNMQTPQGFKSGTIRKAYQLAFADADFTATDDCGIVKRYLPDEPVFLVNGDYSNIKITYPEDLQLMELFIHRNNKKG